MVIEPYSGGQSSFGRSCVAGIWRLLSGCASRRLSASAAPRESNAQADCLVTKKFIIGLVTLIRRIERASKREIRKRALASSMASMVVSMLGTFTSVSTMAVNKQHTLFRDTTRARDMHG